MSFALTLTNQGQVSIPAQVRRMFRLQGGSILNLEVAPGEGMKLNPVRDIFEFAGAFKTVKKISSKKIRRDFEKYLGSRA